MFILREAHSYGQCHREEEYDTMNEISNTVTQSPQGEVGDFLKEVTLKLR